MSEDSITAGSRVTVARGISLQHQIYDELCNEIRDGLWIGNEFHTEKELAARFDVSAITSRAVLDRLAGEGWISRLRGKRATVLKGPDEIGLPEAPLFPIGATRPYEYDVKYADVRTASYDACDAFGLARGSSLWQCSRLRRYSGTPHSVAQNAQLPEVGCRHDLESLQKYPMIEILRRMGIHVKTIQRSVSAVAAPPTVSSWLEVNWGSPMLLYSSVLRDAHDSVVECVRIYLNPKVIRAEGTLHLDSGKWELDEPM